MKTFLEIYLEDGEFTIINMEQINSVDIYEDRRISTIHFINGNEITLRDDNADNFVRLLRTQSETLADSSGSSVPMETEEYV